MVLLCVFLNSKKKISLKFSMELPALIRMLLGLHLLTVPEQSKGDLHELDC